MTDRLNRTRILAAGALLAGLIAGVEAQMPVTQGEAITQTFTIDAIDYKARLVTLKDDEGLTQTLYASPDITRFDELKAGDKVEFRYHESVVFSIRRPGQPAPAEYGGGVTRRTKGAPGGVISEQITASVTVTAIDPNVPSLKVKTDTGRVMGFKIEDKKNLEGLKVGDQIDITYTQALAVSVNPAK